MQKCRNADMQVYMYASMQVYRYKSVVECWYLPIRTPEKLHICISTYLHIAYLNMCISGYRNICLYIRTSPNHRFFIIRVSVICDWSSRRQLNDAGRKVNKFTKTKFWRRSDHHSSENGETKELKYILICNLSFYNKRSFCQFSETRVNETCDFLNYFW